MKRLGNAACELFVAWPVVTAVWVLDKAAGWWIDARVTRFPNVTADDA